MSSTWKIKVTTHDGQTKEFTALSWFVPTADQKLLWKTATGEEKVTAIRIRAIVEKKDKDE